MRSRACSVNTRQICESTSGFLLVADVVVVCVCVHEGYTHDGIVLLVMCADKHTHTHTTTTELRQDTDCESVHGCQQTGAECTFMDFDVVAEMMLFKFGLDNDRITATHLQNDGILFAILN